MTNMKCTKESDRNHSDWEQVNSMNKTKWPTFRVDNRLLFFQGKKQQNYVKYSHIKILKALSWETDLWVTLGDFTVKYAKLGREICNKL